MAEARGAWRAASHHAGAKHKTAQSHTARKKIQTRSVPFSSLPLHLTSHLLALLFLLPSSSSTLFVSAKQHTFSPYNFLSLPFRPSRLLAQLFKMAEEVSWIAAASSAFCAAVVFGRNLCCAGREGNTPHLLVDVGLCFSPASSRFCSCPTTATTSLAQLLPSQ